MNPEALELQYLMGKEYEHSDDKTLPTTVPPPVKVPVKIVLTTNVEPIFDNLIDDNLSSTNFKTWIDSNLDKEINSQLIRKFFLSMFSLLSEYDSCFERGSFIFQNDTNVLFNILTFDKLKITSSSYNCNDPLSLENTAPAGHPIKSINVHSIGTKTHRAPITQRLDLNAQAGPCVPAVMGTALSPKKQRKNHKFERIFDGDLTLDDVCNQCNEKMGDEHHHLRVALYYPYVLNSALNYSSDFTNNNKKTPLYSTLQFLFVKFETQPVSGTIVQKMSHIGNYFARHMPRFGNMFSTPTTPTNSAVASPTNSSPPTPTNSAVANPINSFNNPSDNILGDDVVVDTDDVDNADPNTSSASSVSSSSSANFDTRREDDPLTRYSTPLHDSLSQQDKDIMFYERLGLSTKTLKWYNKYVRIGQEFFVSQQLLEYLLTTYLFKNYVCSHKQPSAKSASGNSNSNVNSVSINSPEKGGKLKKTLKRKNNIKKTHKRHKKTQKRHKKTNKKQIYRKRYN